ncbi:MAG: histidinol dehydrogenase [Candidatus Thiosymbion ectosymbiont of Robbea hypermnestra]|nr:histidinol dehydrogenase [Candidatus Thiosymbion ectosymbiont of Robbea hypermnestra]
MKINVFDLQSMSKLEIEKLLRRSEIDIAALLESVDPIIRNVRENGDDALLRYAREFDGAVMEKADIKVSPKEMETACRELDQEIKDVIEYSARNIGTFHEKQMPEEMWFTEVMPGILAGEKTTPITSAGLYVPSGKGSFPSVMLMLGIPAVIAGVPQVIVCTPPRPDGSLDPAILFAASVCGITEVYRVGGAQAIAAMAYGTETVPRVVKTLGPGSSYVTAAKRKLFGDIDPGTPAGPSESIVLCDESAEPRIAALDLLIEAEHGPDSSVLLVTHSGALIERVKAMIPGLVADLPAERRGYCETVLSNYGGIVKTASLDESIRFANEFAPEHLEMMVAEPLAVIPKIRNAGEILIGKYTPLTIGNFSLGVNAVLPTGGFARSFSCVTVFDFLKRTSIGYVSQAAYPEISRVAQKFAEYEGFPSHAAAIRKRGDL